MLIVDLTLPVWAEPQKIKSWAKNKIEALFPLIRSEKKTGVLAFCSSTA